MISGSPAPGQVPNERAIRDGSPFRFRFSFQNAPKVGLASGGGFWSNNLLPGVGGGVGNLGNPIDISADGVDEFVAYNLADAGGYAAPSTCTGINIPAAMGGAGTALATQDNYTGFGDQLPHGPRP